MSFIKRASLLFLAWGLTVGLYSQEEPLAYESGHSVTADQMASGYNAPGRIDLKDGWNLWMTGSFIYWQALEQELYLARSEVSFLDGYPTHQKYYDMSFGFKPGFKAGLGFSFDHDGWELFTRYTWLHMQNKTSYSNLDSTYVIIPSFYLYSPTYTDGTLSYARSRWHLSVNMIDLEMARSFYAGTNLVLRPFVGPKGGWIKQRYLETLTVNNASAGGDYRPYYDGKIKSWKVGARAGCNLNWFFSHDFRMEADLAASLLYAHYRSSFTNYSFNSTSYYTLTGLKKVNLVQPVFETALGFGWGAYLGDQRCHLDLSALYEFQVYLCENQFLMEYITHESGDLYLHGLTVSMRFDF